MPIAITDDHRALADTATDLLAKRDARRAARSLLEASDEGLPPFWDELVGLGWLGLHLPEEHGGSGYSLEELVVVVQELGRAVAPTLTPAAASRFATSPQMAPEAPVIHATFQGNLCSATALTLCCLIPNACDSRESGKCSNQRPRFQLRRRECWIARSSRAMTSGGWFKRSRRRRFYPPRRMPRTPPGRRGQADGSACRFPPACRQTPRRRRPRARAGAR